MNVEWTDDPHPRNSYWELWGLPLFDVKDSGSVMFELNEARKACAPGYIRINAFDASYGTESCAMSFIAMVFSRTSMHDHGRESPRLTTVTDHRMSCA